VELLHSMLFTLPGSPILYYGDEIGMGDNIFLGDRNGVRTPMQWSQDRNAGFSRANPSRLYSPVIIDPLYNYEAVNVENALTLRSSFLNWLRYMIQIRQTHRPFSRGQVQFLEADNKKVLAYLIRYREEVALVANNLSRFAQFVELDLKELSGYVPVDLFGHTRFPEIGEMPYLLTLSPYGFYWFKLVPAG